MSPSITRSCTIKVTNEDYIAHLVNLLRGEAVSSSWNDSLNIDLKIIDATTHEDLYLQALTYISVYQRNVEYGYIDIGGSQSDNEVNMSIEVNCKDKADFWVITRLLESYILSVVATHATMSTGRSELRLRLKLNNSKNLSEERSKTYRQIFDVSMRVTYSL